MKTNYPDFLKQKCGKVCGYVLWGGYFLFFILMASYTAYLFSTLMLNGLVENISFYLVHTHDSATHFGNRPDL